MLFDTSKKEKSSRKAYIKLVHFQEYTGMGRFIKTSPPRLAVATVFPSGEGFMGNTSKGFFFLYEGRRVGARVGRVDRLSVFSAPFSQQLSIAQCSAHKYSQAPVVAYVPLPPEGPRCARRAQKMARRPAIWRLRGHNIHGEVRLLSLVRGLLLCSNLVRVVNRSPPSYLFDPLKSYHFYRWEKHCTFLHGRKPY